jgi:hypothetical protein
LKPVFGENAFHAARADYPAGLPQLLCDHFRGSVTVKEAVSDDLPDHLGRSSIVCFRTAFLASQSQRARFAKEGAELKIALFTITEPARRLERSAARALPFDEHQQLPRDLVVLADVQDSARANQRVVLWIELCHFCFLRKGRCLLGFRRTSLQGVMVAETAHKVQPIMAVILANNVGVSCGIASSEPYWSYVYRHNLLDHKRAGRPPAVEK